MALIAIAVRGADHLNYWGPPEDISTHGHAIDEQMKDTMYEAGLSFLAAQLILGLCSFGSLRAAQEETSSRRFPGGAKGLVIAALVLVGTEILALGVIGQKAWANVYFVAPDKDALTIQSQAGQFAFYFRYRGTGRKVRRHASRQD